LGLSEGNIELHYDLNADDFAFAGEASSCVKKKLVQLGLSPNIIKKVAVSMYEAEINAVIHAKGGRAEVEIDQNKVVIKIIDEGPEIPDIELAMQEGYSTATDDIREMGFGAGMGLPNIKRYADKLDIKSEIGKGTTVTILVNFG
jgi:serine/threonine-protein kinase RsbT